MCKGPDWRAAKLDPPVLFPDHPPTDRHQETVGAVPRLHSMPGLLGTTHVGPGFQNLQQLARTVLRRQRVTGVSATPVYATATATTAPLVAIESAVALRQPHQRSDSN